MNIPPLSFLENVICFCALAVMLAAIFGFFFLFIWTLEAGVYPLTFLLLLVFLALPDGSRRE